MCLVTILSGCEVNNFAGQSAESVCHNLVAMFDLFRLWLGAVLRRVADAPQSDARKPRPSPTTRRLQTQATEAKTGSHGQTLLGRSSPVLGSLEKGTRYRPTGHGCALSMSSAVGLISNTIRCWWISAMNC